MDLTPLRSCSSSPAQPVEAIRLALEVELTYGIDAYGADFVFNVHAAHTPCQQVVSETLRLSQQLEALMQTAAGSGNRYLRVHAGPGELRLNYAATIDLLHHRESPERIREVPVRELPLEALGYIYPSRYCQSDRLGRLAIREFGTLRQGYSRVQAICDWVHARVGFASNTSNANTSAVDTLVDQAGVCRDFAHLMIALCRALSIPARFATGIDYGSDPALGPQDFHAYVEVFLGDRWYMFDPSGTAIPMGFVRMGTGRDAADVAFATIFGSVLTYAPRISISPVSGADGQLSVPHHCSEALSTDAAA